MQLSPETLTILMFIALFIALFLGHPLAFSLGAIAVLFGIIGWGGDWTTLFYLFANKTWGIMTNYVLVAIPLFIFMAQMLNYSGIAEKLYHSLHILLGPIRGGLALATIVVCTIFAASTGIIGASVVAMGLLAAPSLLSRGYKPELTAGVICAGGTLGILIPPSIMLVVYGGLVGLSVGKLFVAAIFPGLILSGLYMLYTLIMCWIKPEWGPPLPKEERDKYSAAEKWKMAFTSLLPPVALIIIVLGSIMAGIATPTEAAGMGALGSMVLTALQKRLNFNTIKEASLATLKTTSMVMILFIGGNCFSSVFMGIGGGDVVADFLMSISTNKWVILSIMMTIIFFLGMFVDWLGILLICIPVFTPIAEQLGFDPLWFALIVCVNLQMSFLTPPFGYALFYLKGVAPEGMTMSHIYRGIVPFVALQIIGLIICIIFPQVITYLPSVLLK